mmetsp:Transcript_12484/g.16290  ORF Transcript_12484/g.16290 Transcript_12484/m.16290 type:complete len:375 (+) Transcript_12484:340-1464(+)
MVHCCRSSLLGRSYVLCGRTSTNIHHRLGLGHLFSHRSRLLSTASSSSVKEDFKYCVDLIQKRDYDAYLCGLLLPSDHAKMAYFATRALNVEIGSTLQDMNSNDTNLIAIQLRLQFWRDSIAQMYAPNGSSGGHQSYSTPVLRALQAVKSKSNFSQIFFERLVDAREMDLDLVTSAKSNNDYMVFPNYEDMERYNELSSSSLIYLCMESLGVFECEEADIAASHVGRALGIISLLKGSVHRAAIGEICIPRDMCEKYSIDPESIVAHTLYQRNSRNDLSSDQSGATSTNVIHATEELATCAYNHISVARNIQSSLPKEARACLIQATTALHYLEQLKGNKYDLFTDEMVNRSQSSRNDVMHYLKLGRTWLTSVF